MAMLFNTLDDDEHGDDSNGQALTRINLNLTSNALAIAHYLDEELTEMGMAHPTGTKSIYGNLDHNGLH